MNRSTLLLSLLLAGCGAKKAPATSGDAAPAPTPAPWPAMPEPGPAPAFTPPAATRFQLSNGLPVTFVRAGSVPIVQIELNVYAGAATDPKGKSGLAAFTADMLNESTRKRDALALSDALQDLATTVWLGADHDYSNAGVETLEDTLDQSLALFAEMLTQPAFAQADVDRVKQDRIAQVRSERDSVGRVAWKAFQRLLFGDAGLGRSPGGDEAGLTAITRKDLVGFHAARWTPDNAGLVVVSRLPQETIQAALEKALGGWKAKGRPTVGPAVAPVAHTGRTIYWIDRKAAAQSYVIVGNHGPAFDASRSAVRALANRPLGGAFTSRVNLNLREDKHWTYGARSAISDDLGGGSYAAWASIEAQHTAAGLSELVRELTDLVGGRPLTEAEFEAGRSGLLQGWPAAFESMRGVLGQYSSADALRRPADWVPGFPQRVAGVDLATAQAELASIVRPADLVVVIVGDRAAHGAAVEALGLGAIVALDEDGQPVR